MNDEVFVQIPPVEGDDSESSHVGEESSFSEEKHVESARKKEENKKEEAIATSEATEASKWRIVVVLMIVVTAALVISSTYVFLSREQKDEFEKSFEQSSSTIKATTEFLGKSIIASMSRFADTVTSEAMMKNESWPFVTSDQFEVKAAHARLDSLTEVIMMSPLVKDTERSQWEEYSVYHKEWIKESYALKTEVDFWFEESAHGHGSNSGHGHDSHEGHESHGTDEAHLDHDSGAEQDSHETEDIHLEADHHEHVRRLDVFEDLDPFLTAVQDVLNSVEQTVDTDAHSHQEDHTTDEDEENPEHSEREEEEGQDEDQVGSPVRTEEDEEAHHDEESHSVAHDAHEDSEHVSRGHFNHGHSLPDEPINSEISPEIFRRVGSKNVAEKHMPEYAPVWQLSPPPLYGTVVNFNLFSDEKLYESIIHMIETGEKQAVTEVLDMKALYDYILTEEQHWSFHDSSHAHHKGGQHQHQSFSIPHSLFITPLRGNFGDNEPFTVGVLSAVLSWDIFLAKILPEGSDGIHAVLKNSQDQVYTFQVDGPSVTFLGEGDFHEKKYDYLRHDIYFTDVLGVHADEEGALDYTMSIYPSDTYWERYDSSRTIVFTVIIACVFLLTATVFLIYVHYVQRHQNKVTAAAVRTSAIVSSLFPENIRDRILKDAEDQAQRELDKNEPRNLLSHRRQSKSLSDFFDGEPESQTNGLDTKPIADLFPETTIMFADLVGFTAWSSVREPCQVFTLLETVYHAFDEIANRRNVFKVETIGDCYVAVCGLPQARKDHAVVMARFAKDCLKKLHGLTTKLEAKLGPDTGELDIRIGLHSGPVTAGVLRGEKSRFQHNEGARALRTVRSHDILSQLFGDTVNTTARMESNGERGRIHISQETAWLLVDAGKGHWLSEREEKIHAKGKGELQTYWLNISTKRSGSSESGSSETGSDDTARSKINNSTASDCLYLKDKEVRLVEWNVDLLLRLLREIVAGRETRGEPTRAPKDFVPNKLQEGGTVLNEVKEIITLPKFNARIEKDINPDSIQLDPTVEEEVRDYVTAIAGFYHDNPFHNFEHASHVAMSVSKLLSRIVAPDNIGLGVDGRKKPADRSASLRASIASSLHDHTYGITSDPLTQFSCVFSALVHDVDHVGVPNTQLVQENTELANRYNGKSVAEQNSVDLAWDLLMMDRFENFRHTIYVTQSDFDRFRQLVVNSVMATDIMDKDLKTLRNARWEKAFEKQSEDDIVSAEDNVNRKATIVIEHLIQASDVSHTMQHWHVYRKWNERLFSEMYLAYVLGRSNTDPSESWYKGEIGFFDFYIIPLAMKLKDCGVFGVSSFEYLNYAQTNRQEWEARGQEVLEEMKASALAFVNERTEHM